MKAVQVYPLREVWGDGRSRFVAGDCVQAMTRAAREHSGEAQLVYMDPPFMTGGTYRFTQRVGVAGWQGESDYQLTHTTYHDQWKRGPGEYIGFLRPVVEAAVELLCDRGALVVHVDWRASAHIRLLLDEVLGADRFVNEVIWAYQSGGRSDRHFARKHDTLFIYKKGRQMDFYPQAVGVPRGKAPRNHLKRNVAPDGRIYFSIRVGGKEYHYYEDDLVTPSDVWNDIAPLQQKDPERTGYETQKPMALLERVIGALSQPGQWILDPFSGSGTTAEAAAALNRPVLAMDRDPFALHLFRRRMLARDKGFTMDPLPRAPWEAEEEQLELSFRDGKAELLAWRVLGRGFPERPSLLPHEDTLVDFWALGRRRGDTFFGGAFSARSHKRPALENILTLEQGEGVPCAMLVDVYGYTGYWDLL
jgi:site-specific DNA-methyltransferase (adenine-specific)